MKVKDVRYLKLSLTSRCNGACITCWHSNEHPYDSMDMDDKIYDHIRNNLFPNLNILDLLSGGEIFLYPRIDTLLSDIGKYKFKTVMETNFAVISEKHRNILKDMNVDFIVSLDGSTKKLQEFLRPACTYETVLDNIRFFKKHGKRITLRMTVSNYNFYDIDNMLRLAETLKVDGVILHEAQYLDSLDVPLKFSKPPVDMEYIDKIMNTKYKVTFDFLLDYYRSPAARRSTKRLFYCVFDPMTAAKAGWWVKLYNLYGRIAKKECCPIANNFIKIDIDGDILFCSSPECVSVGNLRDNSLQQVLDNKRYDDIRKHCTCKIAKRFINNTQKMTE